MTWTPPLARQLEARSPDRTDQDPYSEDNSTGHLPYDDADRTDPPPSGPAGASGRADDNDDGQEPGDIDRARVVAELADQMRDAIDAGERWKPDYAALMDSTGRRRSWCEKAVRDARMAVLDPPPEKRTEDPADTRTSPPVRTGTGPDPAQDPDRPRTGEPVMAGVI